MASWEVFSVAVRLHLFVRINLFFAIIRYVFLSIINKKLFYYYYYFFLYFGKFDTNYSKEPKSVTAVN